MVGPVSSTAASAATPGGPRGDIMRLATFTLEEFLRMVERYNTAVWPAQIVAYVLAAAAVLFAILNRGISGKLVSAILAAYWLWVGIAFNWISFAKLYPPAIVFAVLFVIQGITLAARGVFRDDLAFGVRADAYGVVGGVCVLYGMFGYQAIEYLLGRGYPRALLVGLVPCPTAIFTLGVLLWTTRRLPLYVLVIPFLYSLTGVVPVSIGIVEDIGLIAAGLAATAMIMYRDRAKRRASRPKGPAPGAAA
jgi:hypothetical protein